MTAAPVPLDSIARALRFGTAMAVLLAVAAFPRSGFFRVQEIVITGARTVPAAEIASRAAVRPGELLFAVPAQEAAARVARHPRLASATVYVTPAGRVRIAVTERTPTAALPYRGGFLVLDASGVAIEHRTTAPRLPLLVVDGAVLAWVRLGDHVPSPPVRRVLDGLLELPPQVAGPGARVRLDAATSEFSLITADGMTVLLGERRGLAERAAILPQLLAAVRQRRMVVEYLDLRFGGSVVLKPAGASGRAGVRP